MKLINVKNEVAVTRTLAYVELITNAIGADLTVLKYVEKHDIPQYVQLRKWAQCETTCGNFSFNIHFRLLIPGGMSLWTAKCRLNSDYYHITIDDLSYRLIKVWHANDFMFNVSCASGNLGFITMIPVLVTLEMLKKYVACSDSLFDSLIQARELAEANGAKVSELQSELEDLKQQLADIYWSTQN